MKNDFLQYLLNWKMSDTPGNFSQTEKDKIFLSRQTYEGLQIAVHDALEEYFGRHWSIWRRNDNPDLYNFDYNSNNIRMQRSVAPSTGNARGARKQSLISWVSVHNTPLPKQHQNKWFINDSNVLMENVVQNTIFFTKIPYMDRIKHENWMIYQLDNISLEWYIIDTRFVLYRYQLKMCSTPSTVDSPHPTKFSFSPHERLIPPTKCYNPIRTSLLVAVIVPVPFLFSLHTPCTHRSC